MPLLLDDRQPRIQRRRLDPDSWRWRGHVNRLAEHHSGQCPGLLAQTPPTRHVAHVARGVVGVQPQEVRQLAADQPVDRPVDVGRIPAHGQAAVEEADGYAGHERDDRAELPYLAADAVAGQLAERVHAAQVGRRHESRHAGNLPQEALIHRPRAVGGMLLPMTEYDPKADLRRYLQAARDALLWKLDGLSEYDARRPMVPTGTNLLGLVKHVASVEAGVLRRDLRPTIRRAAAMAGRGRRGERRHVGDRRRVATPDRGPVSPRLGTLGRHDRRAGPRRDRPRALVAAGAPRGHAAPDPHAHDRRDQPARGHADIVRELIDGTVGLRVDNDNMAPGDQAWWDDYRGRLEAAAREAASA